MWAGPGTENICHGCEQPTAAEQYEFECEVVPGDALLRMCRPCFRVWSDERER